VLVGAWSRFVSLRQAWRLAGVGMALAIALSAVTAVPASAIVVRLANGKEISYEALGGRTGPNQFDDIFTNVDYSGGPIMPSNTNYVIAWEPSNYYPGHQFQANYLSGVDQFFTDIAHNSGQATNGESVVTQYNDASGQVAAYQSSFPTAHIIDTNPLPASGCAAATPCITDAQFQSELSSFLTANHLPRDLTHEYFLLTPPNLTSCFDGSGSSPCSGNIDTHGYCAYHSASTVSGGSFIYAYIPDLAGVGGCDPFAHLTGLCPVATCHYDNGPADGVLSAIEHEHAESLTDPQPNNAWTDWGFSNGPEEMADKCNNDAFSDPNIQLQKSGSTATPYNYSINGHHYLLQMMWSNQGHTCIHSFTPNGTVVHASFTQTASSGDSVSFDASASTPSGPGTQYVWQFNNGPGQQTNTYETSSPSTSESFSSHGGYVVALTVMAPDGTSYGTAHTVFAVDHGPNPVFTPPRAYAGIPTTFSGGASTDPNPGAGIVSYSWDFGDGTTGSGKSAAHTFSRIGTYTVTLTVEDNFFARASVSQDVTVSAVPPPSFVPRSGLARQTLHFGVTGPIPPGSSYSWKFGDGSRGHGAHATHRYARAGTYRVTLTITSSDGRRRTVSLRVRIGRSCRVPNVKGDSLARARRALSRAACRVGTITHHGHSHVTAENPHAGKIVAIGRRVNLTF
jgi:PKD repeat protein